MRGRDPHHAIARRRVREEQDREPDLERDQRYRDRQESALGFHGLSRVYYSATCLNSWSRPKLFVILTREGSVLTADEYGSFANSEAVNNSVAKDRQSNVYGSASDGRKLRMTRDVEKEDDGISSHTLRMTRDFERDFHKLLGDSCSRT